MQLKKAEFLHNLTLDRGKALEESREKNQENVCLTGLNVRSLRVIQALFCQAKNRLIVVDFNNRSRPCFAVHTQYEKPAWQGQRAMQKLSVWEQTCCS